MLELATILILLVQVYFWEDVFSALPEGFREWFLLLATLLFFVVGLFNLPKPIDSACTLLVGFYSGLSGMHYYTKRKNGAQ